MCIRTHLFTSVLLALFSQFLCIQYTPVDVGDLTDCALVLHNSAQFSTSLLESDFGGPVNCITYDAINRAYSDARKRIDTPLVEDNWKSEEVAAIGQLLLDISQQLTREFSLGIEDVELGLPQIDVSKTPIRDICPVYLSSITCRIGRYRRHDGLCNNPDHPTWGATMTPFTRLLPPQFADHISAPRMSITGKPLPSARIVSRTIHPDEGYHDHAGTTMTVAWGQFMDHDFTLMGTPLDERNRNEPEECCYRPEHLKNPYCMEIEVPEDDYFYRKYNVRCQDFVRAFPGAQPKCRLGSRNPFNTLTGVIDGNTIYGVTEQLARQLRTETGGLLKMNPAFGTLGLKELLPKKIDIPDEGCIRTNLSQYCFLAGEIRVNEQLILTCIHTLMAREHNRIAKELALLNPHWSDEILYQEARRITVAEIQHITFNEFLPLILGKDVMEKYGLLLDTEGYWDGYSSQVNPSILDAFSAAAFRFGHSLLPSSIERWSRAHKFIASKRLSDVIRRPYDLYRAGVLDEYFTGLLNQVAQAMDDSVTQEVTNNLFKKTGNRFGFDLVSFNIQRGRDFGLPGYMYFRKHCGLHTVDTFAEMFDMMPNSTIYRYMSIYEHPWDIDLWSGGVAENPLPGSMVGPTFACIIATQMNLIRRGDRFWYELPSQPSSFTPEQLQEIRKVKLSRILCDNSDFLDTVQIYAMVLPDHDINPRIPCRSSVIPRLDLSYWADVQTESTIDKTSQPTAIVNEKNSVESNQSTPAYEYHIKTIAIIEGFPRLIKRNDLRDVSSQWREDSDVNHQLFKRDTAHLNTSEANFTLEKEIVKRHSYHSGPRRSFPGGGMTQAIMKGGNPAFRHRTVGYPVETNIEGFFRKNVPIYDGIPVQKARVHSSFTRFPSSYRPFAAGDEEEEEEDGNRGRPMIVEEVDPEHDSQYEHVPMMVDELGKQRVMENYEEEVDSKPQYPFSRYQNDQFDHRPFYSSFNRASGFPSTFDHSSFRSQELTPPPHSSTHPPLKYGTSHQYNSLADERPRYYKHFGPSIRSNQRPSSLDDDRPYPYPSSNRFTDQSPPSHHHDFDFAASRDNTDEGPFRTQNMHRTARVPQTLEEYHRIHNTFENPRLGPSAGRGFRSRFRGRPHKRVIVPQKDGAEEEEGEEEEEAEEKGEKDDKDEKGETDGDEEESPGNSKSFVSMNFKNFGFDRDDGSLIKHHLTPSRSRFNSYKTPLRDSSFTSPLSDSYKSPLSDSSYKPGAIRGSSFKSIPFAESSFGGSSGENSFRSRSFGETRQQRPEHLSEAEDVEYPPLPLESSETMQDTSKFKQNSEAVKSFVDSIFNKNKALEQASNQNQIQTTRLNSSPFNPNFGERMKITPKSPQNKLWHRSPTATDTDLRTAFRNMKNDLIQPAKRDATRKENGTEEAAESVTTEAVYEGFENLHDEDAKDNEPEKSETEPVEENHDEDRSHERYWSESYSEPNK